MPTAKDMYPRSKPINHICDYGLACLMPVRIEWQCLSLFFFPKHDGPQEDEMNRMQWHASFTGPHACRVKYLNTVDMLMDIRDFMQIHTPDGCDWRRFIDEYGSTIKFFDPLAAEFVDENDPWRGPQGPVGGQA